MYKQSFRYGTLVLGLALALIIPGFAAEQAGTVLFHADTFAAGPDGKAPAPWSTSTRLSQFSPEFSVAASPSLGGAGSLRIYGASAQAASGDWQAVVKNIRPGHWYSFEAFFRASGVAWPQRQAMARLVWLDSLGNQAAMPEYVPESGNRGEWGRVAWTYAPPEGTVAAQIELFLSHCPQGIVWWDDITLKEVPEPPARLVKVGAANCRPDHRETNIEMAEQFVPAIEEAGRKGCDILVLGETITLPARGNFTAMQKAEPIPGPITARLGELARKYHMYLIVGLLENENGTLYNTAALLDREGQVAGKYRKVHLPLADLEIGVVPGDNCPVFDTDFGRIGILICYDIQFADPARALAVQGAEVLFCPNWGSGYPLGARAQEEQVYIASSGYDTPTDIVGPDGKTLARSETRPGVAVAEIDLNRGMRVPGAARKRQYLLRELRPDIIVPGYGQ